MFLPLVGIHLEREKMQTRIFASADHNHSPFVDDIQFMIFGIMTEKGNRMKYEESEIQDLYNYLVYKYPRNKTLLKFAKSHR